MLLPDFIGNARQLGYKRRWIGMILGLQLCAVLFEGAGISMVLPILEHIKAGGDTAKLAEGSQLWQWLSVIAASLSVPLNLVTLMLGAFIAILVRQVFLLARDVANNWVRVETIRRLRNQGFHNFIHAALDYHDRLQAGAFVNEMTTELQSAVSAITSGITFMGSLILSTGYIVIVFLLSPSLTMVAVVVLLSVAMLLVKVMVRIRTIGIQVTEANQQLSRFLVERLQAVHLVRLSGVEAAEEASLKARTQEQRDRIFDQGCLLALLGVLIEPIVLAVAFVLLYVAVTSLQLPFETVILFFFILLRLVPQMKEGLVQRQAYLGLLASIEVISKRLTELSAMREPDGGTRLLEKLDQGISFKNISFRYGSAVAGHSPAAALENVTLEIPAGTMTALVGPSGAGKSTLVDLIPRLRVPQSGAILFDGVPQEEFSSASLRHAIAYAPQSPQIFDVSPTEHIRYGRADATGQEIEEAARIAQADEFIRRLANGYDTPLGEGAGRLSGGQRQRLDLARALVRRAPVLVLDEPTSNLDADAEALFREALHHIRVETDITIIIIGHRLSTVRQADKIVVMEAGRISQSGTHESLMKKGGWYARAFAKQHEETPLPALAEGRK